MGACCSAQYPARTPTWGQGQLSRVGQKQQRHSSFQKGLGVSRFAHRRLPQQGSHQEPVDRGVLPGPGTELRCWFNAGDLSMCCQPHRSHSTVCRQPQPPGPYLLVSFCLALWFLFPSLSPCSLPSPPLPSLCLSFWPLLFHTLCICAIAHPGALAWPSKD